MAVLEKKVKYESFVTQDSEISGLTIGPVKKEFPNIKWTAYIKGDPGTKCYRKKTKIANNVRLDLSTYFWITGPRKDIYKFVKKYHLPKGKYNFS